MGFPTQDRFKILQEQYANAQQIAAPSPSLKPQMLPGIVIDFIARSDSGHCLKVIPFAPRVVTTAGELTFNDGTAIVPTDASSRFFVPVYPVDCSPADIESTYSVGQVITYYPYWGSGGQNKVRGTYICEATSSSIPIGEFQGMAYMNVTQNQMGSSYPFAHELL